MDFINGKIHKHKNNIYNLSRKMTYINALDEEISINEEIIKQSQMIKLLLYIKKNCKNE